MQININTDAVIKFTNTLEKLSKSALPNAVRYTLNNAAFDVKQRTMPKNSKAEFINRSPNFFKANSSVEQASGFSIKSMKATVGFTENKLKGGNNYAVKDLQQQEEGGIIGGKSFIPLRSARQGNSNSGLVRPNARLSKIKSFVRAGQMRGKNKGQKIIKAVLKAGRGGFVLGANQVLYRVESLRRKKVIFKLTPLYTYKKNRKVKVKSTDFMKESALKSGARMQTFFKRQAKYQIEKYRK